MIRAFVVTVTVAAGALVAASALLSASVVAPTPTRPTLFDTTRIAPNVYSFRWATHRNLFVVTEQGVLVTDPLNPDAAEQLSREIRELTDAPVKYVVYSHEHWDHVLGGRVFKEQGAQFVSHARCAPHFERNPHPDLIAPDLNFEGSAFDLELGERTFELGYLGPNRGECMVVMRLPEERLLYVVDLANPQTVGFRALPDFQPRELVRTLKEIETTEFERIVPGHMDAEAPASVVKEQRKYFEDLIQAVRDAMKRNVRDPAVLTQTIRLPRYEHWSGYEEWLSQCRAGLGVFPHGMVTTGVASCRPP